MKAGAEDPWVIMQPWCVSIGIRLPGDSIFKKWKYIFLSCKRSPEVSSLRLVWQLLGLQGPGLLFFCSTSFKFASWCKMAAGALAIMSAFQGSWTKMGQKTKGAYFSAGAAPFTEHSKNFLHNTELVITRRQLSYKAVGGGWEMSSFGWMYCFSKQKAYTEEGKNRATVYNSEVRRQ